MFFYNSQAYSNKKAQSLSNFIKLLIDNSESLNNFLNNPFPKIL